MKGDIFYLKDPTGQITHKFVIDEDSYFSLMGKCYEAYSWSMSGKPLEYHFVTDVYCKWDSCTHWYFYGEDYDPDTEYEKDSYYHLCGGYSFMNHITAMCFVWKLAEQLITKYRSKDNYKYSRNYTNGAYYDHERIRRLISTVLDGYEIVKGE